MDAVYVWWSPPAGSHGQVAELADALDLGSSGATHPSSSLGLPNAGAITRK